MKGLFIQKTAIFKVMAIMVGLVLTACGAGGGDDPIDLGGGGACDQQVSNSITSDGGSVESKDGKATVSIATNAIPPGESVPVAIRVRCGMSTFDTFAYDVLFTGNPPSYSLSIRFDGSVPPGVVLALGTFTGDSTPPWDPVPNASIANNIAQADGLSQQDTYGVFVQSSGGGGNPPSAPTNVTATVPNPSSCRIVVSWSASVDPDHDLRSYIVFRDGTSITTVRADTCFGTCQFQDSNQIPQSPLTPGPHTYFIRATDQAEHSADSNDSNLVQAPSIC